MKKDVHLFIDYQVWKAYKRFCANLEPEEYASKRIEEFMKKDMKKKKKNVE